MRDSDIENEFNIRLNSLELTTTQAADLLCLSIAGFYGLENRGEIKPMRITERNKHGRYSLAEIYRVFKDRMLKL